MTDQQLIEIAAHPRIQELVRRIAREEARNALLAKEEPKAPRGHVSIAKAAKLLGYTTSTVRTYKCTGQLQGKRGHVSTASLFRLKRLRAKKASK